MGKNTLTTQLKKPLNYGVLKTKQITLTNKNQVIMYYLQQSYSDQIIICNPNDEIIARIMYYDFTNELQALLVAQSIVSSLNQ